MPTEAHSQQADPAIPMSIADSSTDPDLPNRVRRLRRELHLTQQQFGERLGVSVVTIHRWETGQSRPRPLAITRLLEMEADHTRQAALSHEKQYPSHSFPGAPDSTLAPPTLDFNGDPDRLYLFAECLRLTHGYQFNPAFASEISRIDPLPHQRIAVYEHMLNQDPLRFLLADDAGAGKTIMTGLYLREMLMRGRIRRVLVVPPAGLVGNWERELRSLFRLQFRIVSGPDARSRNPFAGTGSDLAIVSLDTIRGETAFRALADSGTRPYDLVVFDEAHKLSASSNRGRVQKTQRYKLAEVLAGCPAVPEYSELSWSARHLLLLTATPHMGKDSPYHHLWRLLDHQVFGAEEAFRRFPRKARSRHFIRRTKEEMVDFQGRPIFRERHCDTFGYDLTSGPNDERDLYDRTTHYLRHSYNLATGNQQAVRLAMGVFQRRLASSTWALLKSFERRIERVHQLISDLDAGRIDSTGLRRAQRRLNRKHRSDFFDQHDAADDLHDDDSRERNEDYEDAVLGAVVAVTVEELRDEIETLQDLSQRARGIIESGHESKFERLTEVLESREHANEKWLVFSEHCDTVNYLVRRLDALGYAGRVATIYGGMGWEDREDQVELFRNPAGARFLIATDAAGEGINLQFCRLMVNYDIPWSPARLEQRMGRIHRYGQEHDVRIVNLISTNTREGRVLKVLLERLEAIREELSSDKVFDVIGRLFENRSLREHMRDALTDEGEQRARQRIQTVLTGDAVRHIADGEERQYGKGGDVLRRLGPLRREVDREQYLHLLPAYVRRFVELACPVLGLGVRGGLDGPFAFVANRAGAMDPLLSALESYPPAARDRLSIRRLEAGEPSIWLHPGEPVFDALCDMVSSTCQIDALRGAVFVDPRATDPYLLQLGEVTVAEGRNADTLGRESIERRVVGIRQGHDNEIVELSLEHVGFLQSAPNVPPGSVALASRALTLRAEAAAYLEGQARRMTEARRNIVRSGLPERRTRIGLNYNLRAAEIAKRRIELSKDPDAKAEDLKAVKQRQHQLRAQRRLALVGIDSEPDRIVPGKPRFLAHALVVPSTGQEEVEVFDARVEEVAMRIASEWERGRGVTVKDVSKPAGARMAGLPDYPGFDLLSVDADGRKRCIEVKGRAGQSAIWMELNEWKAAMHLGERYWLYVVFGCATSSPTLVRIRNPATQFFARATTRLRISATDLLEAGEGEE